MTRVTVVGSVNQDITVTTARFPLPGETLTGAEVHYRLGGKGANQAAAAARAGVDVRFIGIVGADGAGKAVRDELGSFGVNVDQLSTNAQEATGTAHITVDAAGENTIIVVPGTNGLMTPETVLPLLADLNDSDIVVLQGEIPHETNQSVLRHGHERGASVILNLAPAVTPAPGVLAHVDTLVVNETEAGIVLGEPAPLSPAAALGVAGRLRELGPRRVVITLGKDGAVYDDGAARGHIPAGAVTKIVDTTGAGDAAVGVLAASLARGRDFRQAVANAMAAGAAACERPGAASSYPEFTLA